MTRHDRRQLYRTVEGELEGLLGGVEDSVAAMATTASLLHHALDQASWTGFYRVIGPQRLHVGPYQGPIACLDIPFERGVCGAAARERRTQIVPDVSRFPGHIACDAATQSEIVVPVLNPGGELVAVLDIDSHHPAAFDEEDGAGLEAVVRQLRPFFAP